VNLAIFSAIFLISPVFEADPSALLLADLLIFAPPKTFAFPVYIEAPA